MEPSLFLELVRTITFFSPVSSTLLLSLYLNKAGTRAREIPNTEYNGTERHTPNLFRCEGEMVYLKQFYELQYILYNRHLSIYASLSLASINN